MTESDKKLHYCCICGGKDYCSGIDCDFREHFHAHGKCMEGKTVIPKDCCLCDFCNRQLTDETFIALEDCIWFQGWLTCSDCVVKNDMVKNHELEIRLRISKGDDLSNTELAFPMVMSF